MDLQKLSDRVERWVGLCSQQEACPCCAWESFFDLVEYEICLAIVRDESRQVTKPTPEEFAAEGKALFSELSRLTASPSVVRQLRRQMQHLASFVVPDFDLRDVADEQKGGA